jgi:TetR/AcrR family transcriptional regulator, transcriptional repressor of aconitase
MPRVSDAYLEKRCEQILEAAVRCFARDGLHRATMQDIVREAALSPGAIYRYFASKEDIIAAIASQRHVAERDMLHEATGGSDVHTGLHELTRVFLGQLSNPGEQEWRRVTVQLWGEALRSKRVMDVVREGLDEPLEALEALIRRGQTEGRVSADLDAAAAARVAGAIFQGLVLQQAWDPEIDIPAYIRAAEKLLDALVGECEAVPRAKPII